MVLATITDVVKYISDATNNEYWQGLLSVAISKVKDFCKREIEQGTYTEKGYTNRDGIFYLKETPVDTISSFKINDSEITDYEIDKTTGRIVSNLPGEIEVTYTGGYSTIPEEVILAVCMVADRLDKRNKQGVATSESVGGVSVAYMSNEELFKDIKDMLNKYTIKYPGWITKPDD